MNETYRIQGKIADPVSGRIFPGSILVQDGIIKSIEEKDDVDDVYILPGLIDAHVHIESSMLTPAEFARVAMRHGTVAAVVDPHEIANVLGVKGVEFMLENASTTPFIFSFGAPSCVPATAFETSGAIIDSEGVRSLLQRDDIHFLSEMMNFPGVIYNDPEVMAKIAAAHQLHKPIDGHAPGLHGDDLKKYLAAGISTDHECYTLEEALEKIAGGMMIQIREGSAARNFNVLAPLLSTHPERVMLCTDDMHPDALLKGHINVLMKRALALGHPFMNVLRACTLNPARHYNIPGGLMQAGDPANYIIVKNLETMDVAEVRIDGKRVAGNGISDIQRIPTSCPNLFYENPVSIGNIQIRATGSKANVIQVHDGQIVTSALVVHPKIVNEFVVEDLENDILKIILLNRYQKSRPAMGLVKGFGLKRGAFASSVAHDSHNIVAVGSNDEDICLAIELINRNKGGICFVDGSNKYILPLAVGGILSNDSAENVASAYERLDTLVKAAGSALQAPYMSLSFMALLVIPSLKMSDKGLFDSENFSFKNLIF